MILLTPALEASCKNHPEARFDFLVFQPAAADPVRLAFYTGQIRFCSWHPVRLVRALLILRRKKYDAALFSSGVTVWKAGLFLLFLRAENKIGEYREKRFPFLNSYSRLKDGVSRAESNYGLLQLAVSLPERASLASGLEPHYDLSKDSLAWTEKYFQDNSLKGKTVMGIHPGCLTRNKYRRWPGEYFISLIRMLREKISCEILVIGGPEEQAEASFISHQTGALLLSNQALNRVAAAISKLDYFINTDSGLGHVAACFDIKTLTIFGPGDERETKPFSDRNHVIRLELVCAPCVSHKRRNCRGECLTQLSPEAVLNRFVELFIE